MKLKLHLAWLVLLWLAGCGGPMSYESGGWLRGPTLNEASSPVPPGASRGGDTAYTVWMTDAAVLTSGKSDGQRSWRLRWGATARFRTYTNMLGRRCFRDEPVLLGAGGDAEVLSPGGSGRNLLAAAKMTHVWRRTGPATRPGEPEPERYEWDLLVTAAPAGIRLDTSSPFPNNAWNFSFHLIVDASGHAEYRRLAASGPGTVEFDGPDWLSELQLTGPNVRRAEEPTPGGTEGLR